MYGESNPSEANLTESNQMQTRAHVIHGSETKGIEQYGNNVKRTIHRSIHDKKNKK